MEKRLKASLGKHHSRMNRETSQAYLRDIFEFLENGIPAGMPVQPLDRVAEVQAAVRDILESTFDGRIPRRNSMRVFSECLNQPRKAVCKPYGRFIETVGINQWRERRKVTSWSFPGSPFRSLAELLLRCLGEFHRVIFVPELYRGTLVHRPLLGRCRQCKRLFLRKSNQWSCNQTCSRKFDYRQRISQKPGYYKKKAEANAAAKKAQEDAWSRRGKPASRLPGL